MSSFIVYDLLNEIKPKINLSCKILFLMVFVFLSRLVNEPYIITTSCLDNASKNTVKEIVRILGGHVVSEWRKDCSLLVMNHISVTIKVHITL